MGQVSDIQPSVAIELAGTVDMCVYNIITKEKVIIAQGTADYYFRPERWDSDGVLTYVKEDFKDRKKQEIIIHKNNNLTDAIKVEPINDTANTNIITNDVEEQKPSEVEFTFYPSGSAFIKSIIDERGSVEITDELRERFNLFARDYKWVYMPDMNYYESFFEANKYAKSFKHNNFGFAIFYVLHYMGCPEKISDEAMQNAIQSLFVAKESYKDMPHQVYGKLADYKNGYYSPRPEGGLDHKRMFYLLTGLDVIQEGSNDAYITVRTKNYYFNDPSYEPGNNEKWLTEKSKELGIPEMHAAAKLLANGLIYL